MAAAGISNVRGTFDRYSGALTVGDELASTSVEVSVEMASVNSGNTMRDDTLRSDRFFDTDNNNNTMTFLSTSIEAAAEDYVMTGDLTICGVTKAVAFATEFNGSAMYPMDQTTHFGFTATGLIDRSDFGVSMGVPLVSDRVTSTLEVQFVQPVLT